ncbi:MAG: tetratricopeptide repeat protein [Acidobacteriota bacterium]
MSSINRFLFIFFFGVSSIFLAGCSRQQSAASVFPNSDFAKAQYEIDKAPDRPLGYSNLAMVYMKEARRTGDFALNENAAAAVARALEMSPNDVPARKLEASLHLAHHRFADAADAAKRLQTELPSDTFAYGVLTDAYMEIGEYEQAVASAQRMVDIRPGTASYSRVAQLRSLYGDHPGAIDMYTEAARAADPVDKEARGWCLVQLGDEYWKNGKYVDAEKVYDEALQIFPGYFLALVSKGRVRASVGDYAAAERLLTELQTNIPNANATMLLADISTLKGDVEEANRQYAKFEATQEKLGVAADHRKLGLSWADRGKVEQALALAEKEYAAEKSIYSSDLLAWALYRSGDAIKAQTYIHEALRLKTNDATLFFHAGMIAKANGKRGEAARLLGAALKLNSGFSLARAEEARKALAELN